MARDIQKIDPDGDLTLKFGNTITRRERSPAEAQVSMLVSSKHLILASPVFKAMLRPDFEEGNRLQQHGRAEIELPDDDPVPFLVLVHIIHAKNKQVPHELPLRTVGEIAILIDKYQFDTDTVELFANFWVQHLVKEGIPQVMTNDLASWLVITWIFKKEREFNQVIATIQKTSITQPIKESLGACMGNVFPVPDAVTDAIDKSRRDHLTFLISYLEIQINVLQSSESHMFVCPDKKLHCDATLLGTLMQRALDSELWPLPLSPYHGYSVHHLSLTLKELEVTSFCDYHKGYYSSSDISKLPNRGHNFAKKIDGRIGALENTHPLPVLRNFLE